MGRRQRKLSEMRGIQLSDMSTIRNTADATAGAPECKIYKYKLSLLANLLNPPEVFLGRCTGAFSYGVCISALFQFPDNLVVWITSIIVGAYFWIFIFRYGLPLYSKGKVVTLFIMKQAVALEINDKLVYVPRVGMKVRRGLAGTHIISRWAHGDYLLVNKDAISFYQLKSEIESASTK